MRQTHAYWILGKSIGFNRACPVYWTTWRYQWDRCTPSKPRLVLLNCWFLSGGALPRMHLWRTAVDRRLVLEPSLVLHLYSKKSTSTVVRGPNTVGIIAQVACAGGQEGQLLHMSLQLICLWAEGRNPVDLRMQLEGTEAGSESLLHL